MSVFSSESKVFHGEFASEHGPLIVFVMRTFIYGGSTSVPSRTARVHVVRYCASRGSFADVRPVKGIFSEGKKQNDLMLLETHRQASPEGQGLGPATDHPVTATAKSSLMKRKVSPVSRRVLSKTAQTRR